MGILVRILGLLFALPVVAAGLVGLFVHMTPENDRAKLAKGLFDLVPEDHRVSADAAITFVTVTLEPAAAHLIVLATGVLMLGTAVWPEPSSGGVPKKGKKPKAKKT